MRIGVDYYPEQWDSSLWESDAETMAKTGVKLIRMSVLQSNILAQHQL